MNSDVAEKEVNRNELQRKTLFTSVSWSVAGNAISGVSMLVISVIMLRILEPADYGVMALANIFVNFGTRFARMGIGPALIQRESIDTNDIRASLTLSVFLGFFFATLLFLTAPLGGIFFKNDAVVAVIRVLSISLVIQGFLITSKSLLEREFQYKKIACVEILSRFVGRGVIALALALMGFGLWSIVIGILSVQFLQVLGCYYFTKHSIRPIVNIKVYARTVALAFKFSLNQFSDFMYANINTLFVGRLFGDVLTGLYERSWALVRMPIAMLLQSLNRVMFPTFSRLQGNLKKTDLLFYYNFVSVGTLCVTVTMFFVMASGDIVRVLLSEKWSSAVIPMKIMACFTCFEYMAAMFMPILDGHGKLISRFWYKQLSLLIKFGCYAIGYYFYSFHGVLVFLVISEFIYFLIYLCLVTKCLNLDYIKIMKVLLYLTIQAAITYFLMAITASLCTRLSSNGWILLSCQASAFVFALACGIILAASLELIEIRKSDLQQIPLLKNVL